MLSELASSTVAAMLALANATRPSFAWHSSTPGRAIIGTVPTQGWFERLTGFREQNYELTQRQLPVEDDELVSSVNNKRYGIGSLTLPTLAELRTRVSVPDNQRTTVRCIAADVGALHAEPEFDRALFQVASQFNLLETTGPSVTPEDGVARYAHDHTQGPACAIAAGAATVYRNYCVPVDGRTGQTSDRQLNTLAQVGSALAAELGRPLTDLWTMRNGYALCTRAGLRAIDDLVAEGGDALRDVLRSKLAVGLHRDVEVTGVRESHSQRVSQAFCSGLPVAYSRIPQSNWETFARLILEAAYEATMLAAVEQAVAGGSNTVLLTRLGGGAFGNADDWIDDAIMRSVAIVKHAGLDVRLVSYGRVERSMQSIADHWAEAAGT
jgi:hypothetical protein